MISVANGMYRLRCARAEGSCLLAIPSSVNQGTKRLVQNGLDEIMQYL